MIPGRKILQGAARINGVPCQAHGTPQMASMDHGGMVGVVRSFPRVGNLIPVPEHGGVLLQPWLSCRRNLDLLNHSSFGDFSVHYWNALVSAS